MSSEGIVAKAEPQTTDFELANRLFFRLYQCANMMHKTAGRTVEEYGITSQQYAVLSALARPQVINGMSVNDLAAFLMVTRQNLTGVINRLERLGLIERARDMNDGRTRLIRMTRNGQDIWDKIRTPIAEYHENSLQGLSWDDQVALLHCLNKILNNFDAQ